MVKKERKKERKKQHLEIYHTVPRYLFLRENSKNGMIAHRHNERKRKIEPPNLNEP